MKRPWLVVALVEVPVPSTSVQIDWEVWARRFTEKGAAWTSKRLSKRCPSMPFVVVHGFGYCHENDLPRARSLLKESGKGGIS